MNIDTGHQKWENMYMVNMEICPRLKDWLRKNICVNIYHPPANEKSSEVR
jgi:hypothetical protein